METKTSEEKSDCTGSFRLIGSEGRMLREEIISRKRTSESEVQIKQTKEKQIT